MKRSLGRTLTYRGELLIGWYFIAGENTLKTRANCIFISNLFSDINGKCNKKLPNFEGGGVFLKLFCMSVCPSAGKDIFSGLLPHFFAPHSYFSVPFSFECRIVTLLSGASKNAFFPPIPRGHLLLLFVTTSSMEFPKFFKHFFKKIYFCKPYMYGKSI